MVNNPFEKTRTSGVILTDTDTPSLWSDDSATESLISDSLDSMVTKSYVDDRIRTALDDRTGAYIKWTSPEERRYTFQDPKNPSVSISVTEEELCEHISRDINIEGMFKKWYPSLAYTEENMSILPKMIIADSVGSAITVLLIKWWNACTWSEPGLVTLENAATLYKQFKIVSMITLSQKLNKTLPEKEADIILKKFEDYLQAGSITEKDLDKKKKRKW